MSIGQQLTWDDFLKTVVFRWSLNDSWFQEPAANADLIDRNYREVFHGTRP